MIFHDVTCDRHGTRCSGEVAAAKNNICGVGIAYDTRIGAIRMLDGEVLDSVEGRKCAIAAKSVLKPSRFVEFGARLH